LSETFIDFRYIFGKNQQKTKNLWFLSIFSKIPLFEMKTYLQPMIPLFGILGILRWARRRYFHWWMATTFDLLPSAHAHSNGSETKM